MSDLIGSHDSRKISRVDNGNIFAFNDAVKAAQQLQKDWIEHGLDAAYLYCDDVDGDWLETWGDDKHEQG